MIAKPTGSLQVGTWRRVIAETAKSLARDRLDTLDRRVDRNHYRRKRRYRSVQQADASPQSPVFRLLSVRRRLDGKQHGCSESARCA